jgi:hypothetical protein
VAGFRIRAFVWAAMIFGATQSPKRTLILANGSRLVPVTRMLVERLLIEPRGVTNTGDAGALTATSDVWI